MGTFCGYISSKNIDLFTLSTIGSCSPVSPPVATSTMTDLPFLVKRGVMKTKKMS